MSALRVFREMIEERPRLAFVGWLCACGTLGMVGPDLVATLSRVFS